MIITRCPKKPETEAVTITVTVDVPIHPTAEQLDDAWDDFLGGTVDEFDKLKLRSST